MWRNLKKYATSDMQLWGKIYIKLPDHDTTCNTKPLLPHPLPVDGGQHVRSVKTGEQEASCLPAHFEVGGWGQPGGQETATIIRGGAEDVTAILDGLGPKVPDWQKCLEVFVL